MKQFLTRACKFLLLLPIVWFGFVILWGGLMNEKYRKNLIYSQGQGFMNLRLLEAEKLTHAPVLIVGSSHVYRGVDVRNLKEHGIEAFNLGSSLQSPIQTEFLLKKYVDQIKPRLVLFEVGYKTFSSDGIEGALDVIINSPDIDLDLLEMAVKTNDISVYNTLAYTFFRKTILGETREQYLATHSQHDVYIPGGYVERKNLEYIGPMKFRKEIKPVNQMQRESFEACLAFLRNRNIKTVLVQTPILADYYTSIENIEEYDEYFRTVSPANSYYNFSDSLYSDTKFFYDHHHLNRVGVDRFNDELIIALKPHLKVLSMKSVKFNNQLH